MGNVEHLQMLCTPLQIETRIAVSGDDVGRLPGGLRLNVIDKRRGDCSLRQGAFQGRASGKIGQGLKSPDASKPIMCIGMLIENARVVGSSEDKTVEFD